MPSRGFAVHRSDFKILDVRQAARWREQWRLKGEEVLDASCDRALAAKHVTLHSQLSTLDFRVEPAFPEISMTFLQHGVLETYQGTGLVARGSHAHKGGTWEHVRGPPCGSQ